MDNTAKSTGDKMISDMEERYRKTFSVGDEVGHVYLDDHSTWPETSDTGSVVLKYGLLIDDAEFMLPSGATPKPNQHVALDSDINFQDGSSTFCGSASDYQMSPKRVALDRNRDRAMKFRKRYHASMAATTGDKKQDEKQINFVQTFNDLVLLRSVLRHVPDPDEKKAAEEAVIRLMDNLAT